MEVKIAEPVIAAMRGRNPDNPKSRKSGLPTEQMLEIKADGTTNALTTVLKDNLVIEPSGLYTNCSPDFQRAQLEGISRTIKADTHPPGVIFPNFRIRKLTARECFKLMDFDDEDFDRAKAALNAKFYKGKDKSNSQMYKMAGNSIVVAVMQAIFSMAV